MVETYIKYWHESKQSYGDLHKFVHESFQDFEIALLTIKANVHCLNVLEMDYNYDNKSLLVFKSEDQIREFLIKDILGY